ncbi:hypothetical protein ACO22_00239 [Paracoccidioides brasiliensis]|uniref:Uncharacterized protein n=1 Tax=Paracoccidioides brasiliensis TaxID=121759 RepID=A0A1D2JPY1_PARBR|nr:hypothetical protein ACO22_00239 [Paracoccidioides brasiliensis]
MNLINLDDVRFDEGTERVEQKEVDLPIYSLLEECSSRVPNSHRHSRKIRIGIQSLKDPGGAWEVRDQPEVTELTESIHIQECEHVME